MLGLGRFLQQQAQAEDDQFDSLVEQLVQRVSEAVLIGDRRDALQQLKDLLAGGSAKAQLAFGAVGFHAVLQVVRDREDLEMVQLALECLAASVSGGGSGTAAGQVCCCCCCKPLALLWVCGAGPPRVTPHLCSSWL